jgi:hypothetical protein
MQLHIPAKKFIVAQASD